MQHQVEMLGKHIEFLKSLDTDEFYDKDENEVLAYSDETIKELVHLASLATKQLVELLKTEFTWSCYFALQILRAIKDPQAVPSLINFLKRESDDSLANEEAMFALQDIGDHSITPLIEELEQEFDNKQYNSYLVGALTGILGPAPYDFMMNITKEFIQNPGKYRGWFHIDDFTYNFVKQERRDAIPILQQVLAVKTLTGIEKREINDTINALENPESYQKEIQETVKEISETAQNLDI